MRRYTEHLRHRCEIRSMPDADRPTDAPEAHPLHASVAAATAAPVRGRALPIASLQRAQQTAGNAAVQRLLTTPLPVQRWDMKISPTASCNDVLDYIAKHSPHRPQAAYTDAHFKFSPVASSEVSGRSYKATIDSANVESDIKVDMPEWAPEGKMASPWAKAKRALRDHEAQHEAIAEETKPTLRTEIEAVTGSGTTASEAQKAALAAAQRKWRQLLNAYQAKQNKLDSPPYYVDLNCP